MSPATSRTLVEAIIDRLAARGVRRIFGVPGGDCNLDFLDAAERNGIEFVLTRSEAPAAIMAAVTAELTGTPGVVMTTRGPGLANAINGVAYAQLDRACLLVIADAYDGDLGHVSHQRMDQPALLTPVVKAWAGLGSADPLGEFDTLLAVAAAEPPGPVYLEVTGRRVREVAPDELAPSPGPAGAVPAETLAVPPAMRKLLAGARRPVLIAGLQAARPAAAAGLGDLVSRWGCPVLLTYKAKGVLDDDDPRALGYFIGGAAERPLLEQADVVVLYGFDPIECPPQRWGYDAPVVELSEHRFDRHFIAERCSLIGDLAGAAAALRSVDLAGGWQAGELGRLKTVIRHAALMSSGSPMSAQDIVQTAARVLPPETRITVDAGAHMLPVMHLWPSRGPRQALISRGLATMGFALPAAIASALAEPERPVVAFTGDGGLMMNPAELATAVQQRCSILVVVFNDSCLSLIAAKQRRRGLRGAGTDFSPTNFAKVAEGFGARGFRAETVGELKTALQEASSVGGPCVVDVTVDPGPYDTEIIGIRG